MEYLLEIFIILGRIFEGVQDLSTNPESSIVCHARLETDSNLK